MIRFAALLFLAVLTGLVAYGGAAGSFGSLAILAVSIAGFSLAISLCTEIFRSN
jgi:hypothetical protein